MTRLQRRVLGALGALLLIGVTAAMPSAADDRAPRAQGMIDGDASTLPPPVPSAGPRASGRLAVEEPGTTPGGGWKLQGPFLHTMQGTAASDGSVTTECLPSRRGE